MEDTTYEVKIDKLVNGGQGLGALPDGRKVFVWNALPGETVRVRLLKQKKSFAEAIAEQIITPAEDRIEPEELNYLATSPWQIMTYQLENQSKRLIVDELFSHEKVELPEHGEVIHDERQRHYRNKMEYSFWGDDDGVHLALHLRGSHGKQIVTGSILALPAIDQAARAITQQLTEIDAHAGDLKTLILRANQQGKTVAALYVKPTDYPKLIIPPELDGLRVYHSNPKSPASVPTKLIYELGDLSLSDRLLGKDFLYDVESFFQVNPPLFEKALKTIRSFVTAENITDMYSGVGTIGLTVSSKRVSLIELDHSSAEMARHNAQNSHLEATVIEASTEKVLDEITSDKPIIFDPPRAGLHDKIIARLIEQRPPRIVYLSCNPATHARDLFRLQSNYEIASFEIYNFFPRTPHIETLALLEIKS